MSPKLKISRRVRREKKISPWVPLGLIVIFGLVVWGGMRFGQRAMAVYDIWRKPMVWDADGILMQNTKWSCVPCSIVMILDDEGIESTTAEIAWISGTDLTGTASEGIIMAGNYYGFDVIETKMGFDELMDADTPAIVFFPWENYLHAVYVRPDRENNWLEVKNPAMGLYYTNKELVMNHFGSDYWDVFLFERR